MLGRATSADVLVGVAMGTVGDAMGTVETDALLVELAEAATNVSRPGTVE